NRWSVSAAAMVATALILGGIASTIGFVQASRNAALARHNEQIANQQRDIARSESARMRQVLVSTDSLLAQANPVAGERKDVTVRELLDGAVQQLDRGAQQNNPDIDASLRRTLAQTYRSLSMWKPAEEQWNKALELE